MTNNEEIELVSKPVKDMYGTSMGVVLGTITDIDGSIQTVGVDCGSAGLQQIPYEQLVVQNDAVIFVPKWRMDSQRLIREKGLTLRRLRALMDIVSENDDMREDAEIIHEKYRSKLVSLDESEREIRTRLEARLTELDIQLRAAKTVKFDSKVQYKSNEIAESTFDLVSRQAGALIEHITHETAEITNVQRRIADLDSEIREMSEPHPRPQDSVPAYVSNEPRVETTLPEAPTTQPVSGSSTVSLQQQQRQEAATTAPLPTPHTIPEPPQQATPQTSRESADAAGDEGQDWLSRMEAQ